MRLFAPILLVVLIGLGAQSAGVFAYVVLVTLGVGAFALLVGALFGY